jgi:hypothetical protein
MTAKEATKAVIAFFVVVVFTVWLVVCAQLMIEGYRAGPTIALILLTVKGAVLMTLLVILDKD